MIWGRNSAIWFVFYVFAQRLGHLYGLQAAIQLQQNQSIFSAVYVPTLAFALIIMVLIQVAIKFLPTGLTFYTIYVWKPCLHRDSSTSSIFNDQQIRLCHLDCSQHHFHSPSFFLFLILAGILDQVTELNKAFSRRLNNFFLVGKHDRAMPYTELCKFDIPCWSQLVTILIIILFMCYNGKNQLLVQKVLLTFCILMCICCTLSLTLLYEQMSFIFIVFFEFTRIFPSILSWLIIHVFQRTSMSAFSVMDMFLFTSWVFFFQNFSISVILFYPNLKVLSTQWALLISFVLNSFKLMCELFNYN